MAQFVACFGFQNLARCIDQIAPAGDLRRPGAAIE